MVLSEVVNTQYAFPVGIVLICAILVFVFGFKSAEEPAFDQLTTTYTGDDRKPAGKKRKLKDKKSQSNGHATAVGESHAEVKTGSTKSAAKAEKSPSKEVSNKSKKQESPIKEKFAGKQKDKKEESKQLKEKKQGVEKSPQKAAKNVALKGKGKGKENEVTELKNKKNEKNLANLKKAEGKPARVDDGGWKQVLSSKEKKNRKKDEPEVFEIIPEKNVGKIEGTPKKKKTKNIDLVVVPATIENKEIEEQKENKEEKPKTSEKGKKTKKPADKTVEVPEKNGEESEKKAEKKKENKSEKSEKSGQNKEESEKSSKKVDKGSEEKKVEKKQNEKKKKGESNLASAGVKEVNEKANMAKKTKVVEKSPATEIKSLGEVSPESVTKDKKNKSKTPPKPDVKMEPGSPKKIPSSSSGNSDSNKKAESVEVVIETKTDATTTVIFDELGDTWKEAKVPKKNKKKARKDQ